MKNDIISIKEKFDNKPFKRHDGSQEGAVKYFSEAIKSKYQGNVQNHNLTVKKKKKKKE